MTTLSFILSARRWFHRDGRVTRLCPPFWPLVALGVLVWGVTLGDGAENGAPVNWVGASRDDVVASLGRPMSALRRGDIEVLMYANNVRIEIRDGEVVSHRSGNHAVLVKSDGTRYAASDRGKVTRLDPVPEEPDDDASEPAQPRTPLRDAAPTVESDAAAETVVASTDEFAEEEFTEEQQPSVEEQYRDLTDAIAQLEKNQESAMGPYGDPVEDEAESPSPAATAVGMVVIGLMRFGLTVLVLRIAIGFVELPCYMPDVLKVAGLFVIIREGIHGLGGIGGHWQWLQLFRAADVISFFALCWLLVQFKVTTQGIIALKIAVATKVATFLVMMAVGIAIVFALGAMF